MRSQFKMEGGRSEMEIQRAVHLHHVKSHAATVCGAHSPLLHVKRRGVQHLLRCIVGPVVVQTKSVFGGGGEVGLADCMHSHLSGGASEKLVVVG